jgi:hypothetical protein
LKTQKESSALSNEEHQVGSKVALSLPLWVKGTAVFGGYNKQYRYRLTRTWNVNLPTVMFVLMNPSVAEADVDDRTVARCSRFAESWGAGRLLVGNTFAYRATQQKRLLETPDPIGPDNDAHLLAMAKEAETIVFAYGKPHPSLRARGLDVAAMFEAHGHKLFVLRLSQDGTPVHPLYLPADLKPFRWSSSNSTLNKRSFNA